MTTGLYSEPVGDAWDDPDVRSGSTCDEWQPARHIRFTADTGSADGACRVYEFMT